MGCKKIKLCVVFLLGFGLVGLQAQESVNATGGNAFGIGGAIAYSIGQVAYNAYINPSGNVSQGVQQPPEISTVWIKETEMNISHSVFPNPTSDNVILQIIDNKSEKLTYQIYDMQGKLLNKELITAQQTQIYMDNFSPATYFINVVNHGNKKVQTFRVIKY